MADIQHLITENLDIWTEAIKKKAATGRGSNSKSELTGIRKLRELILELAVRGKLVPQGTSDEPVSILLKEIAEKKSQLIADKIIKKQKALPEITEQEKFFTLPKGWKWERLGNFTHVFSGNAFKSEDFTSLEGIKSIKITNAGVGKLIDTNEFLPEKYLEKFSDYIVQNGDILLAMTRPFIAAGLKVSLCDNNFHNSLLNQRVASIRSFAFSKYNFLVLSSPYVLNSYVERFSANGLQPNLKMADITELLIPLPPLAEQKRIVAKVDELMTLCDQLELQTEDSIQAHQTLVEVLLNTLTSSTNAEDFQQNWQRIAEHFDTLFTTEHSIDQLKQTILQLAVMGKLVPQNPDDEPASVLLEKIAAEKAQLIADKKIKKPKLQPEISEEEKAISLPEKWEWCRLLDITKLITDGAHHTPTYTNHGVPFLSVKDMSSGSLNFSDTRFISQEQHEELIKRCNPEIGDILLTKIGTTGVPIKINIEREFSIFVSVALIKFFKEYIDGQYLIHLFSSPLVKQQSEIGTQGVGNKNLVLKTIALFQLPIPPLEEQKRIVTKVDELMTLCGQLKTNIQQSQATRVNLAETLVKQGLS